LRKGRDRHDEKGELGRREGNLKKKGKKKQMEGGIKEGNSSESDN
jgi:hypothetical protein